MKTRHYFASANTNNNFVNFFDYINNQASPSFRYVIKGGSGCGKSTLMKKIGNYFSEKGYDLEFFYCSSDPNSLDGIRIVAPNISIVDGTAPHVTEAKIPSVVDKIINLGEFISDEVEIHKTEIIDTLNQKAKNYSSIYSYLKAIGFLDDIIRKSYLDFNDKDIEECILSNCSTSFDKSSLRKLFISALDENGITNLVSKNNFTEIYLPINKYEFAEIAEKVKNKVLSKGTDLTLFYDIFSSDKILGFLVNDKIYYSFTKEIPLSDNEQKIKNRIDDITNLASDLISDTRKIHFKLEKYYSNFIDFDMLNKIYEELKLDIEKRINKMKNFN